MNKIVIIGSPGAGKTTLAKDLGFILKIDVYHLDRLFWQRSWKAKTRETRIDILQEVVQEMQWIIEGTYLASSEPRLQAADTIIFLNTSPLLCLYRIIKRHLKNHGDTRRDIPMGCTDKLTLSRMLKVLAFPLQERRKFVQKLHEYRTKRMIWLRSPQEVENFLAWLGRSSSEAPGIEKVTAPTKILTYSQI